MNMNLLHSNTINKRYSVPLCFAQILSVLIRGTSDIALLLYDRKRLSLFQSEKSGKLGEIMHGNSHSYPKYARNLF